MSKINIKNYGEILLRPPCNNTLRRDTENRQHRLLASIRCDAHAARATPSLPVRGVWSVPNRYVREGLECLLRFLCRCRVALAFDRPARALPRTLSRSRPSSPRPLLAGAPTSRLVYTLTRNMKLVSRCRFERLHSFNRITKPARFVHAHRADRGVRL
ncbi:hypothetical protein EVAR_35215_1 [Eumeta japonica]|uniref:Uncharacterized protein n=1 Tax=Eumeta variegata TaxID=151549 RepID=A0A4C1VCQ2_EUMVA|nr:hypothetical protein EVAR_35215_1 [Eumeta japonica]